MEKRIEIYIAVTTTSFKSPPNEKIRHSVNGKNETAKKQ